MSKNNYHAARDEAVGDLGVDTTRLPSYLDLLDSSDFCSEQDDVLSSIVDSELRQQHIKGHRL